MAKTIIDQLVVSLDLDPKKFKEGEKQAVDALRDLEKQGKKTGEAVSDSADKGSGALAALGRRVLTVAAIFKVLSYTTKNILDASRATYGLVNASRLLGESPRMLRNFENIGEMFGSTAESVEKSVRGIKQAVHDLAFNGQMSNQLVQLGRLGVQFQDRNGRAREFKDIYLDTASALHRGISSGQMSEADALMFAESAGFDPGLARSMVGGRDAALLALQRQEARRQVSTEDVAAATANEQAITSAGQAKDTAFTAAQTKATGLITRTAGGLEAGWHGGATGDVGVAWEGWKDAIEPVTTRLGDLADAAKGATQRIYEWGLATGGSTRADINNNPGNLTDGSGNFRKFATREEGILAARRQLGLYRGRGNNTIRGMISKWNPANAPGNSPANLEAYIADVSKQTGIAADAVTTDADDAAMLAAMFNHEGSKYRYDDSAVADVLSLQQQASSGVMAGRTGGAGETNVQIDEVNVITSATDANGMATGAADALKRKLTAAQVDQGMR